MRMPVLSLTLFLGLIAQGQTMPSGAHRIVINQCSSNPIELESGTSKIYLAKVHDLHQSGHHCEAMNLFGTMITNWQTLLINHSSDELATGYVNALDSAIKFRDFDFQTINTWVDYYIATIPDSAKLSTVLRLSIEAKRSRVKGCDRNRETIDKTLQETLLFQELHGLIKSSPIWDADAESVAATQGEMLSCLASKRVREAEYMFLPSTERGVISILFMSHDEIERNVLAAGVIYLEIIKKYRDILVGPDGGTYGDLALLRLGELPPQFIYKGKTQIRDWLREGKELMGQPMSRKLNSERAQLAKPIFEAKIKLEQALELLSAHKVEEAADLLLSIVLNLPTNRFVMQAHDLLKELEAKSLITLNWATTVKSVLASGFENGEYSRAQSRFNQLTEEMLFDGSLLPTSKEVNEILVLVESEENKLQNLKTVIPKNISQIKEALLELKAKLTQN